MTLAEQLTILGFQCLGTDVRARDVTLWLKPGVPDVLLTQTREHTHADDAVKLIYAAGLRDKAEEISGRWRTFTDALQFPDLSDTWRQARERQREQQEQQIERLSMSKT